MVADGILAGAGRVGRGTPRGRLAMLVAALMVVAVGAGCGSSTVPPSGLFVVTGYLDDETGAFVTTVPGRAPTIQFLPNGMLTGSTGCNTLMAGWMATGPNSLTIRPGGTTRLPCPSPEASRQEGRFTAVLVTVTMWRRTPTELILSRGGAPGEVVVRAQPRTVPPALHADAK